MPPLEQQAAVVEAVWRELLLIDRITATLGPQNALLGERRAAAVTGELAV